MNIRYLHKFNNYSIFFSLCQFSNYKFFFVITEDYIFELIISHRYVIVPQEYQANTKNSRK